MTEPSKKTEANLSFEEFVLFYESTERVTDQRLSLNRWNYSICTVILVACAGIFNWGIFNPEFFMVALMTIVMLCVMAMLFCILWVKSVLNAKALNNAKFDVLTEMAPLVRFSNEADDNRISFEPFRKEWELLEKRKELEQVHETGIIALKPSNIEYLIPKVFLWLFGGIIIVTFIVFLLNWNIIFSNPLLSISHTNTPTPVLSVTPTP